MDSQSIEKFLHAINEIEQIIKRIDSKDNNDSRYLCAFAILFKTSEMRNGTVRLSMTDISRRLHVTKAAATYIVKSLYDDGIVERIEDPQDHRITYIAPTPKGNAIFDQKLHKRAELFIRASERLGEEDQRKFAELFERFLIAVNEEMEVN